jgi:choline dehydrogenase-like flavoprotein
MSWWYWEDVPIQNECALASFNIFVSMRRRAPISAEVVIIGGGLAGLSAAIYLGRAKCNALLIDDGKSMARWEPHVQNYLGFPGGISGDKLLRAGREQARRGATKCNIRCYIFSQLQGRRVCAFLISCHGESTRMNANETDKTEEEDESRLFTLRRRA